MKVENLVQNSAKTPDQQHSGGFSRYIFMATQIFNGFS